MFSRSCCFEFFWFQVIFKKIPLLVVLTCIRWLLTIMM
jgi:hypothetical protein